MKKRILAASAMLLALNMQAQTCDWSAPIEGKAQSIFFDNFTQTPILETSSKYYGFDAANQKILWSIDVKNMNSALSTLSAVSKATGSSDVAGSFINEFYEEIENTQFARIKNYIIDVATGEIVLGTENTSFKSLDNYDVIPSQNWVLFKVKTDTEYILYCVDIATNKLLWNTKVGDVSKGKDFLKAAVAPTFQRKLVQPSFNNEGKLIYGHAKKLFLIDPSNGSIKWENECNPAMAVNSLDDKYIISVENAGGLATGTGNFSKKMNCINAATGEKVWAETLKLYGLFTKCGMIDNNRVAVATLGGLMVYEIATAKPVWKKPFSESISDFELTKEGIKAVYGNRIMLINTETGEKVWKKPVEMDDIDEESGTVFRKEYKNTWIAFSSTKLVVYNNADNKKKWSLSLSEEDKVALDDRNSKIVVISGKKVYVIDPENDAKCPSAVEAKLDAPKDIVGLEIVDNGYFVYGMKEFLMVNKDKSIANQKAYPQVKTGRLANAALLTNSIIRSMGSTTVTTGSGENAQTSGVFCSAEQAQRNADMARESNDLRKELKANNKMKKAVRSGENTAVFMTGTKESGNKISAAVVDKNTGKELKMVQFSQDPNVVYEIDTNSNILYFIDGDKFCAIKL